MSDENVFTYSPVKFVDFTIYYRDRTFKVHKSMLANKSTYFATLFDGDPQNTEMTLDQQTDPLSGLIVGAFRLFCQLLYDEVELDSSIFFYNPLTDNNPTVNEGFAPTIASIAYLAHYFHCKKIENGLSSLAMQRVKNGEFCSLWKFLFLADFYHWDNITKIATFVGLNLNRLKRHYDEEYNQIWPKLSKCVQNQILAVDEMYKLVSSQ